MKAVAASFLIAALAHTALADGLKEARARVAAKAAAINSVEASFVQEKHLAMFREVLKSKGKLYFVKPDRLRWELTEPLKTGFAMNGTRARRWREAGGKTESTAADRDPFVRAMSDELLAWAAADFPKLDKQYEITLISDNPAVFRLVPLSAEARKYVQAVEVAFSPEETSVSEVRITEAGGDSTVDRFYNVRTNGALDPSLFGY